MYIDYTDIRQINMLRLCIKQMNTGAPTDGTIGQTVPGPEPERGPQKQHELIGDDATTVCNFKIMSQWVNFYLLCPGPHIGLDEPLCKINLKLTGISENLGVYECPGI